MGSCTLEFHWFKDGEKSGIKNDQLVKVDNSNYYNNNIVIGRSKTKLFDSLINQKKIEETEDKIKKNLNIKIPKIGKIIKFSDFEKLLKSSVSTYIKKNKLDYKSYLPQNIITWKSLPIEFHNGNVYSGNWNEKTEMEGYGIYYVNNEKVITEGIWLKGSLIFGRIFSSNGDIYEGEITNNVFNGKGKLIYNNGETYEGEFYEGEISGNGKYNYPDKTEYEGSFKNGLFCGKGVMKWINGIEYSGNFVDSSLSGKGELKNIQGEKYEGYFDKNEFNGEGEYFFRNGDVYQGNFECGIKKGKGIYKRNDKVIFEGIWNNDLPDGSGEITYGENKMKGYWRNGLLVGDPEVIEGSLENFNEVDLNVNPSLYSIYPISLPHLTVNEVNTSHFTVGRDISFL